MGNSKSAALTSSAYSAYMMIPYTRNILDEEVAYVEERCCHLGNPLKLLGGRHSYMLIRTKSGRIVRFDYTYDSPLADITYDYYEFGLSEVFRSSSVLQGTTVNEALKVLRHHSLKEEYHLTKHNCQTVVRDSYNALTGHNESTTRNDYLLGYFREASPFMRNYSEEESRVTQLVENKLGPLIELHFSNKQDFLHKKMKTPHFENLNKEIRENWRHFEDVRREDFDYSAAIREMEKLLKARLGL